MMRRAGVCLLSSLKGSVLAPIRFLSARDATPDQASTVTLGPP